MEVFVCAVCGNADQSKIVHLVEEGYDECLVCHETLIELVDTSVADDSLIAEQIIRENDNSLFY